MLRGVSLCAALALLGSAETASAITPAPVAALNSNAASDSADDWSPWVATDGAGNWVAVWHSQEDLGGTLGTDWDLLVSRSNDDGANWSDPEYLHDFFKSDGIGFDGGAIEHFRGWVATDGDGTWVATWMSADQLGIPGMGSDQDILMCRSTDNGATWTSPALLNYAHFTADPN
jgi:Neuraminidase (sialidase)